MTILGNPSSTGRARLGEELPIFCERCGYSLHGLTQVRCEHCEVLQFHCPECGHHQPINTLRPAVQRALGRVRATWLTLIVFLKLNFFGWLLLMWFGMGSAWSYQYDFAGGTAGRINYSNQPFEAPAAIAFSLFGLFFGMAGRMLLLRWRSSGFIGLILAALVFAAIAAGVRLRVYELRQSMANLPQPWTSDMMALIALGAAMVIIGALFVWPIWAAMARALLPRNAAHAMLEWQRSQSDRAISNLGRD